mgnify:CR=1 FL=1
MNKNTKKILAVVLTIAICATSIFAFSACNVFRRNNNINDFADELFKSMFSGDAMSANFFFEDAKTALGGNPTAKLPRPSSKEDYDNSYSAYKTQAVLMAYSYRYSKMNDADKDLFTFLQYFFIQESKLAGSYYMQDSFIGGYSGMQASLPVYLTEYKLRNEQDVKDYIFLMNDTASAFPEYVNYEVECIRNGFSKHALNLFYAVEQTGNFTGAHILNTKEEILQKGVEENNISIYDYMDCEAVNPDEYATDENVKKNFVYKNMVEKIKNADFLNEDQKTAYTKQATEGVRTMIKAYVKLGNDLKYIFSDTTLRAQIASVSGGYASYGEAGKNYYSALFQQATGTRDTITSAASRIIQEFNKTTKEIDDIRQKLVALGIKEEDIDQEVANAFNADKWDEKALYQTIETLKGILSPTFPAFSTTAGQVKLKVVDESMKDNFAPAAYFVSPLDNKASDETIIINNWDSTGYLSYDLLSHEGIPGHLYQYNYLKNSNHHNVVKVLCPTAYKEGWATYAEHYSAELYGEKDSKENLIMRYRVKRVLAQGYLRVLADMKVNYDGASFEDIEALLTAMGIDENSYFLNSFKQDPADNKKVVLKKSTVGDLAKNLFIDAIMQPANAATYYYGYIQVTDVINGLRQKGYSLYDAHKAFLDAPYTFTQIKEKYGL